MAASQLDGVHIVKHNDGRICKVERVAEDGDLHLFPADRNWNVNEEAAHRVPIADLGKWAVIPDPEHLTGVMAAAAEQRFTSIGNRLSWSP